MCSVLPITRCLHCALIQNPAEYCLRRKSLKVRRKTTRKLEFYVTVNFKERTIIFQDRYLCVGVQFLEESLIKVASLISQFYLQPEQPEARVSSRLLRLWFVFVFLYSQSIPRGGFPPSLDRWSSPLFTSSRSGCETPPVVSHP